MNIQSYIESGILDLYVADALSPTERQEVAEMAANYPAIRSEINSIEQSIEQFAQLNKRQPNANVKVKLLEAIEKIEKIDNIDKTPSTLTQQSVQATETQKVVQLPSTWLRVAAAASLALFFVSSALNVYLYQNWQQAHERAETLFAEKDVLAKNNAANTASYREQVATITNPAVKTITLKGQAIAPDAKVTIYWSKEKQATLALIQNLPAAPADKQYQLWALLDGKPIDAGMLDSLDVPQRMKDIANAQAFAITLENKGGSPTPHLENLYAMGTL